MYKRRKVIYSYAVILSLNDIRRYIITDSKTRAEKFINKLLDKIDNLEQFPHLGIKNEENKYLFVIDKNYLITYKIINSKIYILTIKNTKIN